MLPTLEILYVGVTMKITYFYSCNFYSYSCKILKQYMTRLWSLPFLTKHKLDTAQCILFVLNFFIRNLCPYICFPIVFTCHSFLNLCAQISTNNDLYLVFGYFVSGSQPITLFVCMFFGKIMFQILVRGIWTYDCDQWGVYTQN